MSVYVQLIVYLGALLCVLVGTGGFVLLRFMPPALHAAWFLPLAALLVGVVILVRQRSMAHALVVTLASFALVWFGSMLVWPRSEAESSDSAFTQGMSLRRIELQLPPSTYRSSVFSSPRSLYAPAGTKIAVFRNGLKGVRWLAFSPTGVLFASKPRSGEVVSLLDEDRDGYAERVQLIASGLDNPHGLVFDGDDLLVAGESTLYRLSGAARRAVPEVKVISSDLPGRGGHWTRSLALDAQGNIYLSAGSSCNACIEKDPRRASVRVYSPEGGQGAPFADGLRNTVGLAFHPVTGDLWGSDNGRDMLGDDLPAEEVNLIRQGGDYGWPYCYGDRVPDPEFGSAARCEATQNPAVSMQAHSAPLGILFGAPLAAPGDVRESLLVAFHGSWNRSEPTGYKLVSIPFAEGRPTGPPRDLVTGWLDGGQAWGRPVALAAGPSGALYVSDDRADCIYRIEFKQPKGS